MKITKSDIDILGCSDTFTPSHLPLISLQLPATYTGFPSPAEEYTEATLDLNQYLIKNAPATILAKIAGDSLIDEGILPGDIAVIDRSLNAKHGDIIVAILNSEITTKILSTKPYQLKPSNGNLPPIDITEEDEFSVFGVLTGLVRKLK